VTKNTVNISSEKDVEEPIKSPPISRGMAVFIIFIAIIYIIPPSISFLHESLNLQFGFLELKHPELFFNFVKDIWIKQFGILCGFVVIFLAIEICKNIRGKKYKLHALAGMLGMSTSLLSISILTFFQESLLIGLFMTSGLLCVYCISVPTYMWCFDRFKEKKWEPIFITVVLGGVITYFLTGYSAIMINEIYTVNAKYFSYTVPVAIFLILAPFIVIVSSATLLYLLCKEFSTKEVNSDTFYNLNKMMSCYILMVISMAFGSYPVKVLELVSSKFDFDPKSPCHFENVYNGYIILDPAHTKVLTYSKGKASPYNVLACTLE